MSQYSCGNIIIIIIIILLSFSLCRKVAIMLVLLDDPTIALSPKLCWRNVPNQAQWWT